MIIIECIEFYSKGYTRWIIVMGLGVLLNMNYTMQQILVEVILRGAKIKSFLDIDVITMHKNGEIGLSH